MSLMTLCVISETSLSRQSLALVTGIYHGHREQANTRMSTILGFIAAKDNGGGGDDWSCKTCKAPVKVSPPTNHHPVFYRLDALPVAKPTVSEH